MRKQYRRLAIIIVVLSFVLMLPIFAIVIEAKTDYGCFDRFYPSPSEVAARLSIKIPPNISDFKWHCSSGVFIEGDEISIRFVIPSGEFKQFFTDNSGYYSWNFGHPDFFFDLFDDHTKNENNLKVYKTFQNNSACGYTNLLVDMDSPETYTLYANYHDWEHCR